MNRVGNMEMGSMPVEDRLRGELAQADELAGALYPMLRHLLANDDHSLFNEEIMARVRGMISFLARQLLFARGEAAQADDLASHVDQREAALAGRLTDNSALLRHVHALALEWQLTHRLQVRNSIDPVLSPLLQSLVAAEDERLAEMAMAALAAQARFVQQQQRMELQLSELPADLFHGALLVLTSFDDEEGSAASAKASEMLRIAYDESRSRIALITRLLVGLGDNASQATSIEHAGVAFFVTEVALVAGHSRDIAVLSTNERQRLRLALALRSVDMHGEGVGKQFACLFPGLGLPEEFDRLGAAAAARLLSSSKPFVTA